NFKEVALANINYDYYSKKEMYATANMLRQNKFEDNYFDYRKNIRFDRNELRFYYPYYRFLNRYFENLVFAESGNAQVDRNSFGYNYRKIQIIDSLIPADSLKNNLLRYSAIRYFLNAKNADDAKRFFDTFQKMNTDEIYLEEVGTLFESTIKLTPGNTITNILLVNTDNSLEDLQ